MGKHFGVGDTVTLTDTMQKLVIGPERYHAGTVSKVGMYDVVDVMWDGFDHAISMRADEIQAKTD